MTDETDELAIAEEQERIAKKNAAAASREQSDGSISIILMLLTLLMPKGTDSNPEAEETALKEFIQENNISGSIVNSARSITNKQLSGDMSSDEWKSSVINFVVDDLEGGDKLITDNDGGLTRFGINKKHNPDVDVVNLTREGAQNIYAKKYWLKEFDQYPPEVQLMAFDASVNHGQGAAKKMLEQSGGNFDEFMKIREDKYKALDASGKEIYQGQLNGWMNRLGKVEEYAAAIEELPKEVREEALSTVRNSTAVESNADQNITTASLSRAESTRSL